MQKAGDRGLGKILRGVQTFFLIVAWRWLCTLPVNPNTAVSFGIGRIGMYHDGPPSFRYVRSSPIRHHSDAQSAGGFRYIEILRVVHRFIPLVARSASEWIRW